MKLLIAIYFFILAIIQMGLFVGIYHYYRSKNSLNPSPYWMSSLVISLMGLMIFGAGILTVDDVAKPQFNFTIANTFIYAAAVLQALFCASLNGPVSRFLNTSLLISIAVFIGIFEWMRNAGTFEMRTAFMCILASALYIWQIIEIRKRRIRESSSQLSYMQYASSAELFFALGRIAIVVISSFTIRQIEQIPEILILFTIAQLVMNTLSYIAIGSYWAEQIALANARSHHENQEIKALLQERETLIGSLLKANKTASTGALSASIAHELNQPLGASSLNIQFLQKKLSEGELNPTLQKEILETLLADNQRAAHIIRSLRSIFLEEALISSNVDLGIIFDAVLSIAKPEITANRIQMTLDIEPNLVLQANSSEIQQVLLNLLINAIQALANSSSADKRIDITARALVDHIEISVGDNGDGISVGEQDHLFELLTSTKRTGMGLGLWLCKHIVTRHGGSIRYESNEGGGAKFILCMPASSKLL